MHFDPSYFKSEELCGFYVLPMMKRAWAAELEVLNILTEICKKNELQYFADWGTLLGAVRHQGFIPWDDDIDICMKRNDYMKLIQILPKELPRGFSMAGMYSPNKRLQEASYVPHLRVIADETQWNFNEYMKYFHGFPYQRIGIDIFPLDNTPMNKDILNLQRQMAMQGIIILREWNNLEQTGELSMYIKRFEKFCNVKIPDNISANWLWRFVDAICALYTLDDTIEVTNWASWTAESACCLKKEWYNKAIYVPFENIEIPVPCGYDKVLQTLYGDYMKYVQNKAGHNYPFYGHMEQELTKQIRAVGFTGSVDEFCEKVSTGELRV